MIGLKRRTPGGPGIFYVVVTTLTVLHPMGGVRRRRRPDARRRSDRGATHGADYFNQLDAGRVERHHVRRLEQLGYTVTLTPLAAWRTHPETSFGKPNGSSSARHSWHGSAGQNVASSTNSSFD